MITLAIDTSARLCAACVYDAAHEAVLGQAIEDIGRGHAERLFPVIDQALGAASTAYDDIGRLGVCIGPGSFTGVRVGVSAMRGLALALSRPVVGISVFEAQIPDVPRGRPVLIVQDARRGEVYAQLFDGKGAAVSAPAAMPCEAAADLARKHGAFLLGSGARLVAKAGEGAALEVADHDAKADIVRIARCAAEKQPSEDAPKPLYLRGADAKPQTGFALPRQVPAS
ncbi:tRNA (adenosine(37)-N6)-threonylcarbamoyltransferase complex dimerization subunit type 1 TsaB [Hoeflea poritis]|uniref:tRNA (Adenosine(37)-N6)-threonylcarbamoyltransferase complex dimerization subunit type 1 TsaB n=1 Tax=Hoeflea poritis TaxID=2993659 RepID=A0ABT4VNW2_9HYPH|nr:tRNA (adenosine(37)-N6)-threonylcarbamoyltransferase complex dimerization subunit type 1 TsaB [Hoeflea poritis]MDA4846309.1 tRNA (adenosine(37)-N6)-threonylcarbamoyltransferase complex dimerization subunit type 1 TsaB [Hoeflea poritis]